MPSKDSVGSVSFEVRTCVCRIDWQVGLLIRSSGHVAVGLGASGRRASERRQKSAGSGVSNESRSRAHGHERVIGLGASVRRASERRQKSAGSGVSNESRSRAHGHERVMATALLTSVAAVYHRHATLLLSIELRLGPGPARRLRPHPIPARHRLITNPFIPHTPPPQPTT
jgi:hypothetical protein